MFRELKTKIRDKGLKLQYVADSLNISRMALNNKLNGKTEFNLKEIRALEQLLDLSQHDMAQIFFNSKSD